MNHLLLGALCEETKIRIGRVNSQPTRPLAFGAAATVVFALPSLNAVADAPSYPNRMLNLEGGNRDLTEGSTETIHPEGFLQPALTTGREVNMSSDIILNGNFNQTGFESYLIHETVLVENYYFEYWTSSLRGFSETTAQNKIQTNFSASREVARPTAGSFSFDSEGRVFDFVAPSTRIMEFYTQSGLSLNGGEGYLLQFTVSPSQFIQGSLLPPDNMTSGIFGVQLSDFEVLFLEVPGEGEREYQIEFFIPEGRGGDYSLTFSEMGFYADGHDYWSAMPAWDNVSLTHIPEPAHISLLLSLGIIGVVLWKKGLFRLCNFFQRK